MYIRHRKCILYTYPPTLKLLSNGLQRRRSALYIYTVYIYFPLIFWFIPPHSLRKKSVCLFICSFNYQLEGFSCLFLSCSQAKLARLCKNSSQTTLTSLFKSNSMQKRRRRKKKIFNTHSHQFMCFYLFQLYTTISYNVYDFPSS